MLQAMRDQQEENVRRLEVQTDRQVGSEAEARAAVVDSRESPCDWCQVGTGLVTTADGVRMCADCVRGRLGQVLAPPAEEQPPFRRVGPAASP